MRDTTQALVALLLAGLARAAVSKDPFQFLLVPCLAAWHESFSTYTKRKHQVNMFTVLIWAVRPEAYVAWILLWVIGDIKRGKPMSVLSKGGGSKMLVAHAPTLIPHFIKNHSIWNVFAMCKMELIGSTVEIDYLGDVDPCMPIMDEISAIQDLGQVTSEAQNSWNIVKGILISMTVVVSMAIAGYQGLMIGVIVAFVLALVDTPSSDTDNHTTNFVEPLKINQASRMGCSDGLYRISVRIFDYPSHRGIGYVKNGVLHTRHHVTNGNAVEYKGIVYRPTYSNRTTDNVSYGGLPQFSQVGVREEVVVALAGPHSRAIVSYKTRAQMDDSGNVYFYGNRSIPGCSGSPVFKINNTIIRNADTETLIQTYALVGTIGWFYDKAKVGSLGDADDRQAVEIMATENQHSSDFHHNFIDKKVVQIFKHPGAGKTRTVAKDLIIDGLAKYKRVYFTGPTNVVCNEAYKAFNEMFPNEVALLTSAASIAERGSIHRPIIVTAHATALSMLAKGAIEMTKKGLWIIDEAHFVDSKTMILKDVLRHRVVRERNGALVEMTATGYDIEAHEYVIMDGSNEDITDTVLSEDDMINQILQHSTERKVLVFSSAMKGKGKTTAESIARRAQILGINYLFLNRQTFTENYPKSRDMEKGIVFTTDISECGANIHPHIVFDFQMTSKMVVVNNSVHLERRLIDQGQRVQRRGRVGRKLTGYPATYVSPGYELPMSDMNRVEHHERMVAAKSLGIDIRDPTPDTCRLSITLTPQQLSTWAAGGEGSIEGMPLVSLITNNEGKLLQAEAINHRLAEWLDDDDSTVLIGDKVVTCSWWDERDKLRLEQLALKAGRVDHISSEPTSKTLYSYLEAIVGKASKRKIVDGLGHLVDNPPISEEDEAAAERNINDDWEEDDDAPGTSGIVN